MARKQTHSSMDRVVKLRIAKILETHANKKNSFVALAKAIRAANHLGEDDKEPLDRRKLRKIVDGDQDLVLSLTELKALDTYLLPYGEGLAFNSLFIRANLLQTIAEAGKPVTFLLGAKPAEEFKLNLDHWDVNALAEIQRGVSNFAPDVRFDIRDVELHDDLKSARYFVKHGRWTVLLENKGPSIVCPGSARATHAAELMLCTMFGKDPFDGSRGAKAELPFHFVWPPGIDHLFPSVFRYSAEDLEAIDPAAAKTVAEKGASALEMGGTVYLDHLRQRKTSVSYGICVAQRRPGGQIWLVLAGVTGPATYAAARLAGSLDLHLRARKGQASAPYWAAVRTTVRRDRSRTFESSLAIGDSEILNGPHPWQPV